MITKLLPAAIVAATAVAAVQSSAIAAPAALAVASTPPLTTVFDDQDWSVADDSNGALPAQPWLYSLQTFPFRGTGPSLTLQPAASIGAGAGDLSLAGASARLLTIEPPPWSGDASLPVTPDRRFSAVAASPVRAPIDISMKPVSGPADASSARLEPAIYSRTAAPLAAGRMGGSGDAPNIFGSVALAAGHTPEDAKWRRVAEYVPSAGVGPWSSVLAEARRHPTLRQLEVVNAWVNHAISYTPDVANYGVADYWGTARESLTRGRGDCKDYAITKMELLRALGVPADDLYLVLVKDLVRRQDHAVLAVRLDGRFVILDSGFDGVMDSEDVRDYRPILTYSGARTWVHGFRRSPDVMVASASTATPAAFSPQ